MNAEIGVLAVSLVVSAFRRTDSGLGAPSATISSWRQRRPCTASANIRTARKRSATSAPLNACRYPFSSVCQVLL